MQCKTLSLEQLMQPSCKRNFVNFPLIPHIELVFPACTKEATIISLIHSYTLYQVYSTCT